MEKLNRKDLFNIFWIVLIYLGIVLIITHGEYVFGSKIDWGFQHAIFPEYFRMLFYKTHDLFPDFALNIGGGQNIYYFAYYGLLSPIILVSYLLPFLSMSTYIQVSSLFIGVFSIFLFYKWIKGFEFGNGLNFVLTLMFAMAGPLLFHSHRHIMFINYMPFLLLGLIGVKRYFSSGKNGLMVISIFLMIMTSYYYSVGGIICLTIYGVYEYLKLYDFKFKDFIKKGVSFALLVILGVLMAGVILLPVAYALLNGRGESFGGVSLFEALIPSINLNFLLYKSYSVGLTVVAFFAIVYLIFMKKEKRFLGICLTSLIIFPIFVYLLNGGLYLDGKALIPFLPLYVLSTGLFLNEVFKKINFKIVFFTFLISLVFVYLFDDSLKLYFLLDGVLFILTLLLYKKFQKKWIIYVVLALESILICLGINLDDSLIKIEDFEAQNSSSLNEIMEDIASADKGVYRTAIDLKASNEIVNKVNHISQNGITLYSSTYNTSYSSFFYEFNNNRASRNMFITSESGNALFESYMGVKYLITDKKAPTGYFVWKKYDDYTVYINKNTLPIGYATDRVISRENYDSLSFPDDVLSLIGNVVSGDGNFNYESKAKAFDVDFEEALVKGLDIEKYKEGYKVSSSGNLKLNFNSENDKIYLLRFTVENPQACFKGDTWIKVNGITNKLTCKSWKYFNSNYTFDYTLSNFDELNIEFSEGVHYIKKIEFYSVDYDDLFDNLDEFKIDEVLGDKISGSIDVSQDGYFNLSIPYDEGFVIKVDGKKVDYEKVNKAFIGFPISEGMHKIEIEFKAPLALFGKIISICAFGIFIVILIYDKFRGRKMDTGQLLVVNVNEKPYTMEIFEDGKLVRKVDEVWIGRNGAVEPSQKIDHDEKTPLGLYNLGVAFGMHDLDIDYPYIKVQDNDYWVDDYKSSHYNYMVRIGEDITDFGYDYIVSLDEKDFSEFEHLKDYEMQYEYSVFIEYNSEGQIDENGLGNNKGSEIFLHCFGSKGYTGGCVAVSKEDMEFIINFLDREKRPKILIKR